MARKVRVSQSGQRLETREKSAIIWTRGFSTENDKGVADARVDAAMRGCTTIVLKNEDYYDRIPEPVQNYDFCYTDDAEIKHDYESAKIPVIEFDDIKAPKAPEIPNSKKDKEAA